MREAVEALSEVFSEGPPPPPFHSHLFFPNQRAPLPPKTGVGYVPFLWTGGGAREKKRGLPGHFWLTEQTELFVSTPLKRFWCLPSFARLNAPSPLYRRLNLK